MSRPTEISLRCVVTEFLSANINLATDEQVAILAQNDRIHSWGPVAELDRILHEMLLVREQRMVRWEQRAEPVFQCFASGIRTFQPDFAWIASRVKDRLARTPRREMHVVQPTEMLRRLRAERYPDVDMDNESQVFRSLAITNAFLKWDEFELHDDDGLDWIFLPNPRLPIFEECPLRQPDVALLDIFDNAAVAIIIGDDQSEQQLRAMHCFLADREIGYEIW